MATELKTIAGLIEVPDTIKHESSYLPSELLLKSFSRGINKLKQIYDHNTKQ